METQDHNSPNLSGHDGNGGVHVCHKCGWPFPNPHPSSKHRKAHKRVCGTIENYKLDKDVQDQIHEEGYDGEPQFEDNVVETPSDKGVERTISRRSSSGVGSRSSRSTRSEDEVFTDAVTEFSESPAVVTGENSVGVMQRFYSLQNENEVDDDTQPTVENPIADADNLHTTNLLKESQLQTVQSGEAEKGKGEDGMASQDHISTNPSTVAPGCTLEIENAPDRNIIQSSEPSSDVDIVLERGTEIISTKDESKLRTSYSGTLEEVAEDISVLNGACDEGKGASDDHIVSVSAGEPVKTSVTETDGVDNKDVRFNELVTSGRCKVESCNEVDSPVYHGEAMNSGDGDTSKSELVGEWDSRVGADENVRVLAAPDILPLEQHPVIAVEDLNQLRGDSDFSEAPVTTAKMEYSSEVFSQDVSVCSLEDKQQRQKSIDEQNTFKEADHISPAISSTVDNKTFKSELIEDLKSENLEDEKDSCNEDKKPSTSPGGIFPEGAAMDAGNTAMDAGDTTSNADSIRSNIEDDGEYFTVMHKDDGEVSVDGLAVGNSVYMKPTLDDVASQDLEHIHINNSMGQDEKITVTGGIEEGTYKEARMEGCVVDNGIDAILKTDNPDSTIKVDVDGNPESSCQSSAAVNNCSSEKLYEDTSCITEGDRVNKQPTRISASDTIVDSGSVADSLDGNWGSVSVISATSDAMPTSETTPLNHPQALEGEENQSRVPKLVTENQHSQSQLSVKPEVEIEQMEHASEIHSTKEPDRKQKGKEVIDKVDNWDSGKQNTALKFLLGEATARSRAESPLHPNHSSSSTSDVMPKTNDGFSGMGHPEMETSQEEMGKEWNSPARYPVNIKTEKRRSKSKPYWAPFLCCSSVNAR